eukprot:scaffold6217_cov73-Cylindrotheca_fusiformis.AAC.2
MSLLDMNTMKDEEDSFERTPRLDISETVFADTFGKPLVIVDSKDGDDDDDDDDCSLVPTII